MTSRPLPSAPRKYWLCQVGVAGTPSKETTWISLPPMVSVSAMRWREGVVFAIELAYTGASSATATRTRKMTPNVIEVRLRLSRRQASSHGPTPWSVRAASAPSCSKPDGASVVTSVSGSVVTGDLLVRVECRGGSRLARPSPQHVLLLQCELRID